MFGSRGVRFPIDVGPVCIRWDAAASMVLPVPNTSSTLIESPGNLPWLRAMVNSIARL